MSHVATVDIEVKDLEALAEAARRIGMELVRGQTTYKWWGRHEGDYPLPAGFAQEDLGKCEHALRIPGEAHEGAYEVGVCRRRDGRPGYTLLWDFFSGGFGLKHFVGDDCRNLKREYAAVVATRQAMRQGFRVQEVRQPGGSIRLALSK